MQRYKILMNNKHIMTFFRTFVKILQGMSLKERVLATMKSEDTEGPFELYVTRTPGYLWALFFKALHVHPIAVTLISIIIGAASGYFFYSNDVMMNVIGMALLIWANWYDCADGQLARMTNQRTLVGRLLDGLAGDIWFFCIYLGIVLRLQPQYGIWIWLLCAYAGFICHGRQAALADYYKNIHLWFAFGNEKSEFDRFSQENARYKELRWQRGEWFEKMYLFFYRSYTKGQEDQTPRFQEFYHALRKSYPDGNIPTPLRQQFRTKSLPLMPLTNILTFDLRVGVLFISLLAGYPIIFPLFEIVILEPVRFYTRHRHEKFCTEFQQKLPTHE